MRYSRIHESTVRFNIYNTYFFDDADDADDDKDGDDKDDGVARNVEIIDCTKI